MSLYNRVVWQDGMFMKQQHFQQLERAQDKFTSMLIAYSSPLYWGITQIETNTELLSFGKIGLTKAEGILEDRTPFQLPLQANLPEIKTVDPSLIGKCVYLCCPLPSVRSELFGGPKTASRYSIHQQEAVDACYESQDITSIEVGKLNFKLMYDHEDKSAYTAIPILKILDVKADGTVVLDEGFIPTCIDIHASSVLSKYVNEFASMLRHRAESIVERIGVVSQQGVSSVADFMLLQTLNRYEPLFWHFASTGGIHPETLYSTLLQVEGELATICSKMRRPQTYIPYNHTQITYCITHLMEKAKQYLSVMSEQRALPLFLKEQQHGIRTAAIPDVSLLTTSSFILAVKADVPLDVLHTQFVTQTKIGSTENILQLIHFQLPGIAIKAIPVLPRSMPFHADHTYFELDKTDEQWAGLKQSLGIALHVSGHFPNLSLQLWAVKI